MKVLVKIYFSKGIFMMEVEGGGKSSYIDWPADSADVCETLLSLFISFYFSSFVFIHSVEL